MTDLERLSIDIRDPGVRRPKGDLRDDDLAWLAGHRKLKWVQVGTGPAFSDKGMAHLRGLTRVERLGVGGGRVTDLGLSYLRGLNTINHLTVTGNFSDRGARRLAGLGGISHLNITSTRGLSFQTEQYLRRSLSNLYSYNVSYGGTGY